MAIEDYIPNVFGTVPETYQGLLGTQETAALQKRSNIQGLLGAALALSQGMSSAGPRRSALQNILGAAAGGYQAAGGAMQQGLQDYKTRLDLSKAIESQASIDRLLKDPKIANDPMAVAYIRANPAEAIKYFAENMPIQQAISGGGQVPAQAPAQVPVAITGEAPMAGQEPALPATPVSATRGADAVLLDRKNALLAENQRLGALPSERAQNRVKANIEQITAIDKQLDRSAVSGYDFASIEATVPQQFKSRVRSLQKAAETGAITMSDLTARLQDIEKEATTFVSKKTDYTNQDRRVAAGMFQGRAIEELTPVELMQLQNELDKREIQKRKAGATVIDMGSREMEKEFAKGVVEDTRASFQAAKSSVKTINTINDLRNTLSKGVYEGTLGSAPRAIDQLATALKVSGKDTQEKLARTAQAMQQLSSLELSSAEAMKGQGSITDAERSLISRAAAGNLRDFTSVEINALLDSLDKVARFKIENHQTNYEIMSGDPIGSKYSKYYKIETPAPYTPPNPSGVTVRRVR